MSRLESVIRPFQSGDIFAARVLSPLPPPAAPPEPITATWGDPISLQAKPIGMRELKGGAIQNEVGRTSKTVRVTNPEDPEQYVDVERIESLQMKDETGWVQTWYLRNKPVQASGIRPGTPGHQP